MFVGVQKKSMASREHDHYTHYGPHLNIMDQIIFYFGLTHDLELPSAMWECLNCATNPISVVSEAL